MGNWKLPSILFDVKFFFLEKLCQLVLNCAFSIKRETEFNRCTQWYDSNLSGYS